MKSSTVLKWVTLASLGLLAACGGVSDIGSGDGAGQGKSGSNGMAVGGGKGLGANGTGANGTGANATGANAYGGASAYGGGSSVGASPNMPGKDPVECQSDMDCGPTNAPCTQCADGTYACDKSYCAGGKCVHAGNTCPSKCATDTDCPVDTGCAVCGDGSLACPTAQCLMGQCQTTIAGCGNTDPCSGLACGAECKSCGPDGVCDTMQLSYCSAEGKCQPGLPQCADANVCKTPMDCGAPPPKCVPCGNDTCATFDCIHGACVFACPPNPDPQCKITEDCPAIDAVCKMCPNGKCAVEACLQGSCELVCAL